MRVTFLGTGTSHGVPSIGCQCPVCCSPDPRDARSRCSILVDWRDRRLLVDTPPELRLQAIRSHVRRVDAVLLTHAHADHIFGLDDLRRYNEMQQTEMPIYGHPATLADVRRAFQYVFTETQLGGGKPRLKLLPIEKDRFVAAGLEIEAIPVYHGELEVTAFRFDRFAYVTDVNRIPAPSLERLRGLHTLVLGALRPEPPHPTHFTLPEALAMVAELAPERAFFVHMTHQVAAAETEGTLPPRVRLAYDGLIIEVPESTG